MLRGGAGRVGLLDTTAGPSTPDESELWINKTGTQRRAAFPWG